MPDMLWFSFSDLESIVRKLKKQDARYIGFSFVEAQGDLEAFVEVYARLNSSPMVDYDIPDLDLASVPPADISTNIL
jgi:hypothetical protein